MRQIKRILTRLKLALKGHPDRFMGQVSGLVHVGANTGQERALYERFGLQVLWIEPIPEVFAALEANLKALPGQRALQALVTDRDDAAYQVNVASNNGASSSILKFGQHKDIWPQVHFTKTIELTSVMLATLFERERVDAARYPALVMDTQGSELLVLQGAVSMLKNFEFIKTETADVESYTGCCQLADIQRFMEMHGFVEYARRKFASRPEGGGYFDVVFRNKAPRAR